MNESEPEKTGIGKFFHRRNLENRKQEHEEMSGKTEFSPVPPESNTLEYKRQIPDEHIKFLKTAVAFANGNGGRIIFGIDDETHKVLGLDEENPFRTADSISNMIYDSCTPPIMCEVTLQTIQEKTVIVAHIYPGEHTPYYIKSLGLENGCFVRVSSTTRLCDRETIKNLMMEGADTGFDRMILSPSHF